jgi:hypothetical protein
MYVNKDSAPLPKLANTFYKVLRQYTRTPDISKESSQARSAVNRALTKLGCICRYYSFRFTSEDPTLLTAGTARTRRSSRTWRPSTWSSRPRAPTRCPTVSSPPTCTRTWRRRSRPSGPATHRAQEAPRVPPVARPGRHLPLLLLPEHGAQDASVTVNEDPAMTAGGGGTGLTTQCTFGPLYGSCVRGIRKHRNGFLRGLLSLFEEKTAKDVRAASGAGVGEEGPHRRRSSVGAPTFTGSSSQQGSLDPPFLAFIAPVLAFLPFALEEKLLLLISHHQPPAARAEGHLPQGGHPHPRGGGEERGRQGHEEEEEEEEQGQEEEEGAAKEQEEEEEEEEEGEERR